LGQTWKRGRLVPKERVQDVLNFLKIETNKALLNPKLKDRLDFLGAETF